MENDVLKWTALSLKKRGNKKFCQSATAVMEFIDEGIINL